jgi:hypothetical protein
MIWLNKLYRSRGGLKKFWHSWEQGGNSPIGRKTGRFSPRRHRPRAGHEKRYAPDNRDGRNKPGHDMESLKALPGSVPQPRYDLSIG